MVSDGVVKYVRIKENRVTSNEGGHSLGGYLVRNNAAKYHRYIKKFILASLLNMIPKIPAGDKRSLARN